MGQTHYDIAKENQTWVFDLQANSLGENRGGRVFSVYGDDLKGLRITPYGYLLHLGKPLRLPCDPLRGPHQLILHFHNDLCYWKFLRTGHVLEEGVGPFGRLPHKILLRDITGGGRKWDGDLTLRITPETAHKGLKTPSNEEVGVAVGEDEETSFTASDGFINSLWGGRGLSEMPEDELRALAKSEGIKHWHVKSILRLIDELEDGGL